MAKAKVRRRGDGKMRLKSSGDQAGSGCWDGGEFDNEEPAETTDRNQDGCKVPSQTHFSHSLIILVTLSLPHHSIYRGRSITTAELGADEAHKTIDLSMYINYTSTALNLVEIPPQFESISHQTLN